VWLIHCPRPRPHRRRGSGGRAARRGRRLPRPAFTGAFEEGGTLPAPACLYSHLSVNVHPSSAPLSPGAQGSAGRQFKLNGLVRGP